MIKYFSKYVNLLALTEAFYDFVRSLAFLSLAQNCQDTALWEQDGGILPEKLTRD